MAGDVFQKFGDSVSRTITKISVRTSSSLEKSKIKMHIESLTKDVEKMTANIGEEVYSLWLKGEASNQSLVEKLEAIQQKKAEIEQLTVQLNAIDDRDKEILGTQAQQTAELQHPAKPCCPNCGNECDPAAKFCRKCGTQLR